MRFLKSVVGTELKAAVFTLEPMIAVEVATAFWCLASVDLIFSLFISFLLQLQSLVALAQVRMPTPSLIWILSCIALQTHLANRANEYPDVIRILCSALVVCLSAMIKTKT